MPSLNTENAILSNAIKVNSSYNVGIGGAASGSFKLNVTGTTNLTGALTGTSGTFSGLLSGGNTSPSTSYDAGSWFTGNGLVVGNISSVNGIQINSSTTSTLSAIRFGDGDGANNLYDQGFIIYRHTTDAMLFGTNRNTNLTIASTGAATFLSSVTSSFGSAGANFNSNAATTGSVNAYRVSNTTGTASFGIDNSVGGDLITGGLPYATLLQSISNTALQLGTNQIARMTILNGGNVGIGRTDPSFILDVNDTNASGARGLRISTSSTAAGPALYLYINNGVQTNWAIGNSYAVSNTLEFISSNSVGGNPGAAGTSRMLITPTGNVTINTARTSGANVNSITLSDNVTGVQTPGFGTRILATSNNGSARSAIAFEQDGGTNNDTAIAFYTQFSAASLDRRMTINRNGNVLVGSAITDYGYRLAVASGTQHLGAGFVFSNDITATTRQCATAFADFSGTSVTFDLASLFPRVTFTNRGLSVTMQLVALPTYTIVSSAFVVLGRTGNSNQWASDIQTNLNINGAVINSVSASGTVITVNYNTFIFGTAYISIATVG